MRTLGHTRRVAERPKWQVRQSTALAGRCDTIRASGGRQLGYTTCCPTCSPRVWLESVSALLSESPGRFWGRLQLCPNTMAAHQAAEAAPFFRPPPPTAAAPGEAAARLCTLSSPGAGKMKRVLKSLFSATNGGVDFYDVAGVTVVPADVVRCEGEAVPPPLLLLPLANLGKVGVPLHPFRCTAVGHSSYVLHLPTACSPLHRCSGKAEEERRRAEKGKACVVDEDEERMSVDTAYSAEQSGGQGKERLRKMATLVLGITPTVEEAIDAIVCPPQQQQQPASLHGSAASLHGRRASQASMGSITDVELAVFGCDSGAPSPSSTASGCAGAGPSRAGSGGSELYSMAGCSGSGSSAGAWGAAGPCGSSASDHGHISGAALPRWH